MSQIIDGGPAFPWIREFHINGIEGQEHMPGMSLRDYLAGQALSGFCAYGGGCASANNTNRHDESMSTECYRIADAMLKTRDKI